MSVIGIIGIVVAIIGLLWLLSGAVVGGIILIVVGALVASLGGGVIR
jgi:hypothetical protein